MINNPKYVERAEIIMEKGTDRSKFFRGEVDKYTWVDLGSSMLVNEMTAAFLWAQLEKADDIITKRLQIWNEYHRAFESLEQKGFIRRPTIPVDCQHNGHIYYILLKDENSRNNAMQNLKENGINAVFHYIPLDSAKAGRTFGKSYPDELSVTENISGRLLRMPMFYELNTTIASDIAATLTKCMSL